MLNLPRNRKSPATSEPGKNSLIRDRLLTKQVVDMESHKPETCSIDFEDPNKLHTFSLTVSPTEGYYSGGHYKFMVTIPEAYNIVPPVVKCKTKLWHPNISEHGEICLSLLRETSIDGFGWSPTRDLKDVIWGINSLFDELLNFEDPLNIEAADQFKRDNIAFKKKVDQYIRSYAGVR